MCEQEGLNLWQTLRTLPRHHYWPCIEYGLQVFSLSLNDISMQRPRYKSLSRNIILRRNSKFVTVWKFLTILANTDAKMTLPQTSVFLWLLLRQFCKRCDAWLTHVTYKCRSNKKIRKIAAQLTLGKFYFSSCFVVLVLFLKAVILFPHHSNSSRGNKVSENTFKLNHGSIFWRIRFDSIRYWQKRCNHQRKFGCET
jgi:hypothetical protein